MTDDTTAWRRLHNEPALDAQQWGYDAITVQPGSLTIHDRAQGSWTITGFPEPQDVVAFMLTGDHQPGTPTDPNDYEQFSGHRLSWSPAPSR